MEISRFAIASELDGSSTAIYCTATQGMALLRGIGLSDLQGTSIEDVLDAEEAAVLQRLGILVPSREAELGELSRRFRSDSESKEALGLLIAPTLTCNFACPYCYERDVRRSGTMSDQTIDRIVAFARSQIKRGGYRRLKVGWYGGEPLMAMDVIEELTRRFLDIEAPYQAMMISNLSLAEDTMIERMAACRISSVITTLDGIGTGHDSHRPSANGSSTYETILHAIDGLSERGIAVSCLYNLDETNIVQYPEMVAIFEERYSGCTETSEAAPVTLVAAQLFDYLHKYGKVADFSPPHYRLIDDPARVARMEYERMRGESPFPAGSTMGDLTYQAMLSPIRLFCGRQLRSYLVIDENGAAYACDGDIGYDDRVLFEIGEGGAVDESNFPRNPEYDPTLDDECCDCAFIPLCMGNCIWTRRCCTTSCIPWKWIADDLIRDWAELLLESSEPIEEGGRVRMLRPATYHPDESPFELWG